jgi:hypothetical protein
VPPDAAPREAVDFVDRNPVAVLLRSGEPQPGRAAPGATQFFKLAVPQDATRVTVRPRPPPETGGPAPAPHAADSP